MQKIAMFIFGCFIFTTLAMACPDVSGEFKCPDPRGGSLHVSIEQNGQEFLFRGLEPIDRMIADGQWQKVVDGPMYKNARYMATCLADTLQVSIRGDLYQSSFYAGLAKVEMQLTKAKDGNLRRKIKGVVQGPLFQTPISDDAVCVAQ